LSGRMMISLGAMMGDLSGAGAGVNAIRNPLTQC
jgi:hypothetical protein